MPYIENSPAEMGDMWRQPDTESIARNFAGQRFNIFYPQFNYDGPLPNYIQLEFQVTTFIIAVLYKLFGHSYVIARLVPTLFFMFSALYLYLICRDTYDRQMAWIAVSIYGLIPLNLFYSRAIMPESALLFFFLGAYYHFLRWLDEESTPHLMLSGIYTALAISQKTPAVFIGLAMLGLCLTKYKGAFL
jgi:4-amino-4-deoxy-L-arabinose transferase-like glycosyltransferase